MEQPPCFNFLKFQVKSPIIYDIYNLFIDSIFFVITNKKKFWMKLYKQFKNQINNKIVHLWWDKRMHTINQQVHSQAEVFLYVFNSETLWYCK